MLFKFHRFSRLWCTHSRTRSTGHKNTIKKKAYTRRLIHALLCWTLQT